MHATLPYPWPLRTDQERCFDARGESIPCGETGQDADRRPCPHPMIRFAAANDSVTDALTGLTWARNANLFDYPYSLDEGLERLETLNREALSGLSDWRLPSRRELFSLVSHQNYNPALVSDHPFENVFHGYYWTATPCARLPDQAWYIHLGGARIYRGRQSGTCLIWPVSGRREPRPSRGARFRTHDGITRDRRTGLNWRPVFRNGVSIVSWEGALCGAAALNRDDWAGHDRHWRLPSVRELESLIDLKRHSPALPDDWPIEVDAEGFWASTTSVYEPRYAWVVYMRDGAVGVGYKPNPDFGAWAVACDGPSGRPAPPPL